MRPAQPALACRIAQRPALGESGLGRRSLGEDGFTLVEFIVAALITTIVLGGTVMLATQIQEAYGTQLADAEVEQEARYALDWIARDLRSAGSDSYGVIPDAEEVQIDPNAGADADDSIRIRADINPPNGVADDVGEDITIAFDSASSVITRQDPNDPDDATAVAMTEAILTDLSFTFLDAARVETANPQLVAYVRVAVTAQARRSLRNTSSTLSTEVRLRTR